MMKAAAIRSWLLGALMVLVAMALAVPLAYGAYESDLAAVAFDEQGLPTQQSEQWEAYGVYGGRYAYIVDRASKSGDSSPYGYSAKIVRADGTVTIDLPNDGDYWVTYPQRDESFTGNDGSDIGYDLDNGVLRMQSTQTWLWGVKSLDGDVVIPFKYDYITPAGCGLAPFAASWHDGSSAGIDYLDYEGKTIASVGRDYAEQNVASTRLVYGTASRYDTLYVTLSGSAGSGTDVSPTIVVEWDGAAYVDRPDLDGTKHWELPGWSSGGSGSDTLADGYWNTESFALEDGTSVAYSFDVIEQGRGAEPSWIGQVSVVDASGKPITLNGYTLGVCLSELHQRSVNAGAADYTRIANSMHNSVKHGDSDVWWATDGDGNWGAVDSSGNVVVPFRYEAYADRGLKGTSYAMVKENGAWSFLRIEGTTPLLSLKDADLGLSQLSFTYDGNVKEPAVTVKLDGKELIAGTDYTVAYSNNIEVGAATVTVTGKGGYTGTAEAAFSIVAADDAGSSDGPGGSSAPTETSTQPGASGASETSDGQNAPSTSGEPAKQEASGSAAAPEASEDPAAPAEAPRAMHRLYNQWSGEHFYTADDGEFAGLVALGWTDEGTGWTAPETSSTPVFRLYNPYAGEHHYTMDAAERDAMVEAGWQYEDVGWYSDDAKAVPLFREYNPNELANNHNYTTNKDEHDSLVSIGWVDEGYAWYGVQVDG